jgi:hypothetical protein
VTPQKRVRTRTACREHAKRPAKRPRARAAGKSRDELRDIYLAERRARNLRVPPDRVLDAVVERIITGNPLPAARIAGAGLVRMGRTLYGISKLYRPDQQP